MCILPALYRVHVQAIIRMFIVTLCDTLVSGVISVKVFVKMHVCFTGNRAKSLSGLWGRNVPVAWICHESDITTVMSESSNRMLFNPDSFLIHRVLVCK